MRARAFRIVTEVIALVAVALMPLACAPGPERDEGMAMTADLRENALVRFVNATTFNEPVDLYFDDTRALLEVGKDKVTDYNEWLAERHDIELRTAGSARPVAANSQSLSAGARYTVVGYNKIDGTSSVAVFRDNVSYPQNGKARIRLIHVADGADELGVFPAGSKDSIVEGVNYKTDSSAEIDPGVKSLDIRKDGEEIVSLKVPALSLEAGKTYTIIVATGADHTLRAIQIENASSTGEGSLRR